MIRVATTCGPAGTSIEVLGRYPRGIRCAPRSLTSSAVEERGLAALPVTEDVVVGKALCTFRCRANAPHSQTSRIFESLSDGRHHRRLSNHGGAATLSPFESTRTATATPLQPTALLVSLWFAVRFAPRSRTRDATEGSVPLSLSLTIEASRWSVSLRSAAVARPSCTYGRARGRESASNDFLEQPDRGRARAPPGIRGTRRRLAGGPAVVPRRPGPRGADRAVRGGSSASRGSLAGQRRWADATSLAGCRTGPDVIERGLADGPPSI